jgi:mRNA interferase MazF
MALWMIHIEPDEHNGLSKPSAADTFQIRSVSEQRFVRRVGVLSDGDMSKVEQALAIVLRIKP